ncbi:ORF7 [Haloarcula hispanica pleomorphic virus 1]|uniref:ORF7 n=1 Tax=Haloarcula hispanica pleomorphic virus 1 TaxID=710112 RepID=D3JVC4_9VIRU|nr:unkown [Haloarcula hispanica pleomorphic virus 1]ADB79723.1 ORF7 [Haloarcula hispanica pleomorphic virus 1]
MTEQDIDEHLLTAAKLREQIAGRLDHDAGPDLLDHAGILEEKQNRSSLSFVENAVADSDLAATFADTALGSEVRSTLDTRAASKAIVQGNANLMSHLVGVTEQELDASAVRLPMMLMDELENNGAPAFVAAAGNPNTGKTNTMLLLVELARAALDDLEVIANFAADCVDRRVVSAHELAVALIEDRDVPKFVVIDEGSTHFDARTNRREVAVQFTPLAKRFAKLNVFACGTICHTGKDLHPEFKRLATLPFFKSEPKVAEFFAGWDEDESFPEDRLFSGELRDLEKAASEYDPDDSAPWQWNLRAGLFAEDYDWPSLLDVLRDRGPAPDE